MQIEDIVTVNCGDWQQIRWLMSQYNLLLAQKFAFLDGLGYEYMNCYERAEADIALARITGRLKAVDAKVLYLLTGKEIQPETAPLRLDSYMEGEWKEKYRALSIKHDVLKERHRRALPFIVAKQTV